MADVEVLWIDDDIPKNSNEILGKFNDSFNGIKLLTAKSCQQSQELLKSRTKPPKWAIVDLIVPQGTWSDDGEDGKFYKVPGIKYIKYLKRKYKDEINIIAYTVLVNNKIKTKVEDAGAVEAFVKSNISFRGVLERIKNDSE
jgi:ActR/RegA family two-component response regulator